MPDLNEQNCLSWFTDAIACLEEHAGTSKISTPVLFDSNALKFDMLIDVVNKCSKYPTSLDLAGSSRYEGGAGKYKWLNLMKFPSSWLAVQRVKKTVAEVLFVPVTGRKTLPFRWCPASHLPAGISAHKY